MRKGGDLKKEVELATAENFIRWYNRKKRRSLTCAKKQEAPDFIYKDEVGEIGLEVTTAYYSQSFAKTALPIVREKRAHTIQEVIDSPEEITWVSGTAAGLLEFVNCRIAEKCQMDFGRECVLIIRVALAGLTAEYELQHEVIQKIHVPPRNPFKEIYVTANQQTYYKLALPDAAEVV